MAASRSSASHLATAFATDAASYAGGSRAGEGDGRTLEVEESVPGPDDRTPWDRLVVTTYAVDVAFGPAKFALRGYQFDIDGNAISGAQVIFTIQPTIPLGAAGSFSGV